MKYLTHGLIGTFALGMLLMVGCSQEVSHSESDKPNWFNNGSTHQEQTTYKNADGTYSTEQSKTKTTN